METAVPTVSEEHSADKAIQVSTILFYVLIIFFVYIKHFYFRRAIKKIYHAILILRQDHYQNIQILESVRL